MKKSKVSWIVSTRRMMDIEQHVSSKILNDDSTSNPKLTNLNKKVVNRPLLAKYLGFGELDFHCIYGYKSILNNGIEVALLRNVRDPLTHDILANHVWVRISPDASKTLNSLSKETPVRVHGHVTLYHKKTKVGLRVQYINLVRGVRTYTIESKKINCKNEV